MRFANGHVNVALDMGCPSGSQRPVGPVGEDLLRDGVVTVLPFGLYQLDGESVNTAW